MGGANCPFEEAVALELRRRGWTVVPQVGVSRFRIDLGIVHPDRPGDYLLGGECDGATYHSAARRGIATNFALLFSKAWAGNCCASGPRTGGSRSNERPIGCTPLLRNVLHRAVVAQERAAAASVSPPIIRPEADPIEPARPEVPPALTLAVPAKEADVEQPEPVYARAPEPVVELTAAPTGDGLYRISDLTSSVSVIDPGRF